MPLTGSASVLATALAGALGATDGAVMAAWGAVASTVVAWLPSNVIIAAGTMVASGAAVTGQGAFTIANPLGLGQALVSALGIKDAAGIAAWTGIGGTIAAHLVANAKAIPVAFVVSNPMTGGPVTGVGAVSILNTNVGPSLAVAAGSVDPAGIAAWVVLGRALMGHLAATTQVLATPIGFVAPPGGGPLTGAGTIV